MKWTHDTARAASAQLNNGNRGMTRGKAMAPSLDLPASPAPRNPLVAPALLRHAGRHGPDTGARRQRERHALRTELARSPARLWPDGDT